MEVKSLEANLFRPMLDKLEPLVKNNAGFDPPKGNELPYIYIQSMESAEASTKMEYGEAQLFILHVLTKKWLENAKLKEKIKQSLNDLEVEGFSIINIRVDNVRTFKETETNETHGIVNVLIEAFVN